MVLAYALLRSLVEEFRGDEIRGIWFDGAISTSQLISLVSGAVALVLLIALRNRRDTPIAT
jgi:prolipoprotein diacylglyceryltransferase